MSTSPTFVLIGCNNILQRTLVLHCGCVVV
ncbi:unnamed protein product [Linum tenue]|uniref:Uncharacterized protein n=1 Tax=Linum tenue TaxID=586396 RepID=A0AAV0IX52_9ROSI|nr:unnamed protein product [Linum tenue]